MFKYTKSEVNPPKNKHMKMLQTFSLWNSIPKSQKRKAPASVESRMGRKKNKCGILSPLLLKLEDHMLHPYIIQTALNCVALKATAVHTNPQTDAATNPPIQARKNTVICVQE